VADNQYAALGLMLLANLARVKRIIRPLGKPKPSDEIKGGEQESLSEVPRVEADLGEVIKREEIQVEEEIEKKIPDEDEDEKVELKKPKKKKRSMIAEESPKLKTAESTPAKRPKKKRKKGDAFDDLFDSLI
jgi:ribonuclease MRP protein subunit RMP1